MVRKKTLIFSLTLSIMLLASANFYNSEKFRSVQGLSEATLGLGAGNPGIVSFALGNLIVYLVLTGVIYLFLRSIVKSFDGPKKIE